MSPLSRRLLLFGPVGVVAIGGIGFFAMLSGMKHGKYDPRMLPSALIGKPVPTFNLPGLRSADLAGGQPVLLNFFASWCVPCIAEAEILLHLQRSGVKIFGIAYKDKPDATASFLGRNGNPYHAIAADTGSVAIDFGVYGVPETYAIDGGGILRARWAGALTAEIVRNELSPLLKQIA
jgi:cytochrome c biogenesis protein CcmG/thiol:disulfide interchange protein DsbE